MKFVLRRIPFTLSGAALLGTLMGCPRPVNNPADPDDDPVADDRARSTDPERAERIDPGSGPPPDTDPSKPDQPVGDGVPDPRPDPQDPGPPGAPEGPGPDPSSAPENTSPPPDPPNAPLSV